MLLRFLGHACFYLEDGESTLVIDPYDPSTGALPEVSAKVVTLSHSHHDHSYADGVSGVETTITEPGAWSAAGIEGEGLSTFHDDAQGAKRGPNIVQIVKMGGQTIVHLGDLGHMPDENVLAKLRGCDVLLVPVGGFYTIDAATATAICDAVAPRVIIPMHYKVESRRKLPIATVEPFLEGKAQVQAMEEDSVDPASMRGVVVLSSK